MAEIINICPRMMTIEQLIDTVKQADENTAITRYFVRQLCKENKIVHIKAGQKYLINYDKFIDYLNHGGEDECQKASIKNG